MAIFLSQIQVKIFLLLVISLHDYTLIVPEAGFTPRVISAILDILGLQLAICAAQYIHY